MKRFLKILLFFIFIFLLFTFNQTTEATSFKNISMDIYINEKGDANITETWDCTISEGTELYRSYDNLGKSQIKDLSVSDNNKQYTTLSSWNTSGTLSSKSYKCCIINKSNYAEICWGINSYGTHTYTINYTITNFVATLNDSQMVYWELIPKNFSYKIDKAYIKISTFYDIPMSTDVWGYGNYGGTAYVYNGYIEMQSNGDLGLSEYMTILVKFPSNTFDIENNTLNNNFDYYLNMANVGSTPYNNTADENVNTIKLILFAFFKLITSILTLILIFVPILLLILFSGNMSTKEKEFNFGIEGKDIPKDVDYFRDIPCNKNLLRAYYIAWQYELINKKTDILGAIILKWLKDSLIRIEKKQKGLLFKKENTVIILNETNPAYIENETEKTLFKMLFQASKDGILENKEFEKWCSKSYSQILNWFDKIILDQKNKLVDEGLILVEETTTFKIIKTKNYTATPALKQEAIQIAGLKRYLEDYTLISKREAIEVILFEEYLMFAQFLGIADKVAKQFKEIYPQLVADSHFISYENVAFVLLSSESGISHANKAKEIADELARARADDYSSGGGGYSSGGGGGGSFGSGGGRRRPLKQKG